MDDMASRQQLVHRLMAALSRGEQADCVQTHASWVILAGAFAYKLKKPIDLGFLDYSTLEKRREACEDELRLNRRTAPELYLDVVPVTGTVQSPELGGAGPVLDYAVRMRRFAAGSLFAELHERGELGGGLIDRLAGHVAAFHAEAAVAPVGSGFGTAEAVHAPVRQNFEQIRQRVDAPELLEQLAVIERWSEARFAALAGVFEARRAAGRVRECHGDLHLRNIVLLDGAPRLFDGIEFNPSLRWIDVMADTGFLVMDLLACGERRLANRFINAYLELSGDYDGLRVLSFYVVYRAMVRVKVAAIRREQAEGEEVCACDEELRRYLALAEQGTRAGRPCLALMSGVSGAGKSRHALVLVEQRGFVRMRSDVERKRLAGLAPHARSDSVIDGGLYTPQMSKRTFERLADLARLALQAGYPVALDATFIRREARDNFRALARELGVACAIVAFDAPVEVLHERVARRAARGRDASEATGAVLDSQLAGREPLDEDEKAVAIEIDTSRPINWPALLRRLDVLCGRD